MKKLEAIIKLMRDYDVGTLRVEDIEIQMDVPYVIPTTAEIPDIGAEELKPLVERVDLEENPGEMTRDEYDDLLYHSVIP